MIGVGVLQGEGESRKECMWHFPNCLQTSSLAPLKKGYTLEPVPSLAPCLSRERERPQTLRRRLRRQRNLINHTWYQPRGLKRSCACIYEGMARLSRWNSTRIRPQLDIKRQRSLLSLSVSFFFSSGSGEYRLTKIPNRSQPRNE